MYTEEGRKGEPYLPCLKWFTTFDLRFSGRTLSRKRERGSRLSNVVQTV